MRPTRFLFHASKARLTLFTRANCSLCDTAKRTVNELRKHRNFDYDEIDVMAEGQKQWKDVYEFDTPVLHVERRDDSATVSLEAQKLWHRFTSEEVEAAIDQAEAKG